MDIEASDPKEVPPSKNENMSQRQSVGAVDRVEDTVEFVKDGYPKFDEMSTGRVALILMRCVEII